MGPDDIAACKLRSKTTVDRFWAACEMFGCEEAPLVGNGVAAPVFMAELRGFGVDDPLLSCVAITEASLREASETICLMFLFRRCDGFQRVLRNGFGLRARSSWSRSCWWESSAAGVDGAMRCILGGEATLLQAVLRDTKRLYSRMARTAILEILYGNLLARFNNTKWTWTRQAVRRHTLLLYRPKIRTEAQPPGRHVSREPGRVMVCRYLVILRTRVYIWPWLRKAPTSNSKASCCPASLLTS